MTDSTHPTGAQISRSRSPLWPYLQLLRPANIVTAWADILAGTAIALHSSHWTLTQLPNFAVWHGLGLLLATTGLYGGGVVFNDICDRHLDASERPERPLPSGRASLLGASLLAAGFAVMGLMAAASISAVSGVIAVAIAVLVIIYDSWAKHQGLLGPVVMGSCRGGNLLLGVSVAPALLMDWWPVAVVPVLYIAAITWISQGEVTGGNRPAVVGGAVLYGLAIAALFGLLFAHAIPLSLAVIPVLGILIARIAPPLWQAYRSPTPEAIRTAVKAGVLSLIVLDGAIAASFGEIGLAVLLLGLLPISLALGRVFSVT